MNLDDYILLYQSYRYRDNTLTTTRGVNIGLILVVILLIFLILRR